MSAIKIGYKNILESSIVMVTNEDADYPAYRLYDRKIGRLFKNGSAGTHTIHIDQSATGILFVNAMYIPAGHNLNGVTCTLSNSDNNSDWTVINSDTPSTADAIYWPFAAQASRYWRLVTTAPELSELFLTNFYEFICAPAWGANVGSKTNIIRNETAAGLAYFLQKGAARKTMNYTLQNIAVAEKTEIDTWLASWGGYEPFLFSDHNDDIFFAELTQDIVFQKYYNRFTADVSILEYLG